MSRRAALADVMKPLRKSSKSEPKRRSSHASIKSMKRKSANEKSTPRHDLDELKEEKLVGTSEVGAGETPDVTVETEPLELPAPEPEAVELSEAVTEIPEGADQTAGRHTLGEGELTENAENVAELGEGQTEVNAEAAPETPDGNEAERKPGKAKKMTKKQLREEKKRLAEEQAREEARRKREERRKRRQQDQAPQEEEEQVFDDKAYREYIYNRVGDSLSLVMTKGDVNLTVDNVNPLLKSFELSTSDEDIVDLIKDALIDSLGMIDPKQLDDMILKKKMESDLNDLEECVDTAFALIDHDGDGLITNNDVYRLMIFLGEVLFENEVADMIKAADYDGDGRISKNDLFLFLLGQKKTVKLEDSILQRLGGEDNVPAADADGATGPKPEGETQTSIQVTPAAGQALDAASTPSDGPETAGGDGRSTPARKTSMFTALEPKEDPQAAERRRKMFSGYAQAVIAANRLADTTPQRDDVDENGKEETVTMEESEPSAEANISDVRDEESPEIKVDDDDDVDENGEEETVTMEESEPSAEINISDVRDEDSLEIKDDDDDDVDETEASKGAVAKSDWSDSGHVESDRDDDEYDESDDDAALELGPLSLDDGICFLPAPEYDTVRTPRSGRSPRPSSRNSSDLWTSVSPRPRCYDPDDSRSDSPLQAMISQDRQDALLAFSKDMERLATTKPDIQISLPDDHFHQDRDDAMHTDRTSEYDSAPEVAEFDDEREGEDEKWLPKSSQQNIILREIENQVINARRALSARARREKRPTRRTRDMDLSDDNETVVEAEIRPVYVPPCAREAGGLRRYSIHFGEPPLIKRGQISDDLPDLPSRKGTMQGQQKETNVDTDESFVQHDLASMTTDELLSKGYVSLSTPRTDSTLKHSPRQIPEDFLHDTANQQFHSDSCQQHWDKTEQSGSEFPDVDETVQDVSAHEHTDNESDINRRLKDILVDGIPDTMRPKCSRAHHLPARKPSHAPLRRSLTCHVVTVKDLAPKGSRPSFFHGDSAMGQRDSPVLRRESSVGRESSLTRRESFQNRKESSPHRFDSSPSRTEFSIGRRESRLTRRASSLSWKESSLARKDSFRDHGYSVSRRESPECGRESSGDRRGSPLGRRQSSVRLPDSPSSWRTSSLGRMDSSRSLGDSSRTPRDSSRRDSYRTQRDSVRSQIDSSRTLVDSSRSYRDSSRSYRTSSLGRAEDSTARTDRSGSLSHRYYEDSDTQCDSSREFRFYGPNFDAIMQQKGEPEESLRENFERDSVSFSQTTHSQRTEGHASTSEGRAFAVSRQLERVKEMERMIHLRNQLSEDEENEGSDKERDTQMRHQRRHVMRSKTSVYLRRSGDNAHDVSMSTPSEKSTVTSSSVRPKSCLSSRRATAISKVVTIAEAEDIPAGGHGPTHMRRPQSSREWRKQKPEASENNKKVHIVDLSSLLSGVNDSPESRAEDPAGDVAGTKRNKNKSMAPLAKVLVAYENARRRQAATAVGATNAADAAATTAATTTAPATTSISRQLQQFGIPYHPPPDAEESVSPRAHRNASSHADDTYSVGSLVDKTTPQGRSFVLSGEHCHSNEDAVFVEEREVNRRSRGARVTSARSPYPRSHSPGVTLEFPERSVIVVKPKRLHSSPRMVVEATQK